MKEATAMILQTDFDGFPELSKLPPHLVVPKQYLVLLIATLVGKIIRLHQPIQVLLEVPIMKAIEKAHITVDDWLYK